MSSFLADNQSETRDCESRDGESVVANAEFSTNIKELTTKSKGFYDAEKCRAYIANQTKVSKIDRSAIQIIKSLEVEIDVYTRLSNVVNMFTNHSAKAAMDFTFRCKSGLQRHRQDRILNSQTNSRKATKRMKSSNNKMIKQQQKLPNLSHYTISNDLLYGEGAQLVQTLLNQTMPVNHPKHIKRKKQPKIEQITQDQLNEVDCSQTDSFDPELYVNQLKESLTFNSIKSKLITEQIQTLKQTFERLAAEHRDNVDLVYAAEEERQAATVTRRSAYNLSMAAFKATSTPVHVSSSNINSSGATVATIPPT